MLQAFFADVLQLGASGGGSFALADNKTPLLRAGILHHLNNIVNTLNHDLIPQIYELNKWPYDARTAARFTFTDLDDGDIDNFSKAVQRVLAVSAVDHTEDIEDKIRDVVFDLPPRSEANTNKREVGEMQSRSGDGMKEGLSSGTGSGLDDEDNSVSNSENA